MNDQLGLFATLSDDELVAKVTELASDERRCTAQLVAALAEMERRRLYLPQGCSSLFTYCTHVLRLSEHAAYNRIEAARAALRFPSIIDRLQRGDLTLTAIRLLAPVLTSDNSEGLLDAACHQGKRDIERLIGAARLGETRVDGTLGPPPEAGNRIEFTASDAFTKKLREARALLRHSIPDGRIDAIIERALDLLLSNLRKRKWGAASRPRPQSASPAVHSRHVPAAVKREVWKRDAGRCAFIGTAGRCQENSFLEFHHVVPFAHGGPSTTKNIELRCRAHNAYEADQEFALLADADAESLHSFRNE